MQYTETIVYVYRNIGYQPYNKTKPIISKTNVKRPSNKRRLRFYLQTVAAASYSFQDLRNGVYSIHRGTQRMLLPDRTEQAMSLPHVAEVNIELAIKSVVAANDEQATIALDRTGRSENQSHSGFPIDTAHIRKVLRARSVRRKSDLGFLLEWPSWDMLLDLVATKLEGQHVSVSSLCLSSGAPQSTALRKLSVLEGSGLVTRYVDGNDRRRICLTLTDEAVAIVSSMVREDIALLEPRADTGRATVKAR